MKHLAEEDLEKLTVGLAQAELLEAYRHLLACGRCRQSAKRVEIAEADQATPVPEDPELEEFLALLPPTTPEARLLGRALKGAREKASLTWADEQKAEAQCARLLAEPAADRLAALDRDRRFTSPGVARRLLDLAEAACTEEPLEADHFAALGLRVAKGLAPPWKSLERAALEARSRVLEGEAWRVRGDLRAAESAFGEALQQFDALPAGAPERGAFCRYLARLRREQGRVDEALALLGRAAELYERQPDPERVAQCQLEIGWLQLEELETEDALPAFEEAAAWWSEAEPFDRWLSARCGLALCHADLHKASKALPLLAEMTAAGKKRSRLDQLRIELVRADVLQWMDDNDLARKVLAAAWQDLAREGSPFEAVLAGLDLARILAEEGRLEALAVLRYEVLRVAELPPASREVLDFVLDFAARHGSAAVEILELGKSHLKRARHNPDLPFSILREPRQIIPWQRADIGLRKSVADLADLNKRIAKLPEAEIPPADRRRLVWTAEATLGYRLVFAEGEGSGPTAEEVH